MPSTSSVQDPYYVAPIAAVQDPYVAVQDTSVAPAIADGQQDPVQDIPIAAVQDTSVVPAIADGQPIDISSEDSDLAPVVKRFKDWDSISLTRGLKRSQSLGRSMYDLGNAPRTGVFDSPPRPISLMGRRNNSTSLANLCGRP